jgi:hypothetical protein
MPKKIEPEAKTLYVGKRRFAGFRIESKLIRVKKWSYHFYPFIGDDHFGDWMGPLEFFSKLLKVPKPEGTSNPLAKFYDAAWDGTIDKDSDEVKALRRKLAGKA